MWEWHLRARRLWLASTSSPLPSVLRPVATVASSASVRGATRRATPALHCGSLRRGKKEAPVSVDILVDTGSQQAPLCSTRVATALGASGGLVSFATQANGATLPIYDVGWCHLGLNGGLQPTRFHTAAIAPYDVILGEQWLRDNRVVMDYADSALLHKDTSGQLHPLSFDAVPLSRPAHVVPLSRPNDVASFVALAADGVPDGPAAPAPAPGARLRRLEVRHQSASAAARRLGLYDATALHAVVDLAKELPEDGELDLSDIPGVAPADRTSFSYIEEDVRTHLSYLPAAQVEAVVGRLRAFECDVFETRAMPRLAPERDFDVPIIERPGSSPPARRPYPVALHHRAELDRQVKVLLDAGIVRRSTSPYAAPVLFAPKKDGKLRMCVDYRLLNAQTVRDRFPTPTASDLIARTRGAQWFSKVDLHSGFHQLRIREEDVHKTAFATPSGLFEFVTAPFGLTNVPGAFQRFMQHVLAEHIEAGYCVVYCDDVAIFSTDADPMVHLRHVEAVLQSLRQHQLLAKGSKCELMRREAEFLGFIVSGDGVRPLPSKVDAVLQIPVPETISHLRSFLGLCNFFRAHLPAFAEVSAPLTDLLKGSRHGRQRLQWNLACDHAFAQLKTMLTSAPLLRHFDPALRTAVHVDASQHAVGAVLLQWEPGAADPRPVCFLSRKLQGAQYRYDARNAEALAAQLALSAWRPYLSGVHFELVSDHASLQSLFQQKAPSHRILRLCEFLADFDFDEVRFVRGQHNTVPDFLSRPWDVAVPDVSLHVLSHPRMARGASLCSVAQSASPQVLLLPVCQNRIAVCHSGGLLRLPSLPCGPGQLPAAIAQQLARALGCSSTLPRAVGRLQNLLLWTVEVPPSEVPPELRDPACSWRDIDSLHLRSLWVRSHFEALRVFGVVPADACLPGFVASLSSLASSAPSSSLLPELLRAQADGAWTLLGLCRRRVRVMISSSLGLIVPPR